MVMKGDKEMSTRDIVKKDPADFTPTLGNYKDLQPFRFWCQKVLPLAYDDSLSYYELLCKVVDYLNKTMEDVGVLEGDVTELHEAYKKLQEYVNNYFSTLDVQEEINNKLDAMAKDGSLTELIKKYVDPFIETQNKKIGVLEERMNTFTKLPSGSTTADAELIDIRVPASGFNGGKAYPTAGDAVRGQVNLLNDEINNNDYRITNCNSLVDTQNLCDYSKVQHGKYISGYNAATKEIMYTELSDRCVTPLIPVKPGKKYAFYGNFGTEIQGLLFDKNLNLLSTIYRVNDANGVKVSGVHGNYILDIAETANHDIMYFIFSTDDSEQKAMLLENITSYPKSELIKYNPIFKSDYVKDAINKIITSSMAELFTSGVISCYGDSLTAGAGVGSVYKDTYCGQLANLLGVTVNRFGVGGDGAEQIAMRQGGQSLYAKPFTIPSNKSSVNIELINSIGKKVIIGYQGSYTEWGINPVTINGIEGILKYDKNSNSNTFTRTNDGKEINVTRNIEVISDSFINNRNDITIIWAGTNGTKSVSDVPYLINMIDSMINTLKTKCYIVVGLMAVADGYVPNKDTMISINTELQNHYGYHYLDVYNYLLEYGLADCNITPTEQDKTSILNGVVPISLRYDLVHLNKNGYSVISNLLAKKIKTLMWL